MDAETYSYWRGWKDARAGFSPEPDDHAEPDAYRAGYEAGSEDQHEAAETRQRRRAMAVS